MPQLKTIIGIDTDRPGTSEIGYSSDILYMHGERTDEEKEKILELSDEFGYFKMYNANK